MIKVKKKQTNKIHPVAQENKYLGKFSDFIMNLYADVLIRITSPRRF